MIIIAILAVIPLIIFWIRNRSLYQEGFGGTMGTLNISLVEMNNRLTGAPFPLVSNFSNYTASLVVKYIFFALVLLIVHVSNSLIVTFIYVLFPLVDWYIYARRHVYYQCLKPEFAHAYSTLHRACICSPVYSTILYFSVFIAYAVTQ